MLADKNNLYLSSSYGLFVIPLKELGLPVIVLAETWEHPHNNICRFEWNIIR